MNDTFGNWINDIDNLNYIFNNNKDSPFEHIIIENFFNNEYVEMLENNFPSINNPEWFRYYNPIENKYAMNNFNNNIIYNKLFEILQSDITINYVKKITGYNDLEKDDYLHGAGLHYHSTGGKLDMHLDYSIHPLSGKERRVNLIVYLNKDWKEEYNGDIQLWDENFTKPVKKIYPNYNRAILFKTSDISWHGLPTPIRCPNNNGRKSIAIYYVSEPRIDIIFRKKAQFRPLPWQSINDKLQQLYDIRVLRTITNDDLNNIYPNWENEGNIFW
jgi:hypothetical protein